MLKRDRTDVELGLSGLPAGRSTTRERPRSSYHTVAPSSEVDETLFKSSNAKLLPSSGLTGPASVPVVLHANDASSESSTPLTLSPDVRPLSTARSRPLEWTPASARHSSSGSASPRSRSHNKYRLVRHTPSYVDEMLFGSMGVTKSDGTRFGPPSVQPSWRAPWDKGQNGLQQPLLFDAVDRAPPPPLAASVTPRTRSSRHTSGVTSNRVSQPRAPWK